MEWACVWVQEAGLSRKCECNLTTQENTIKDTCREEAVLVGFPLKVYLTVERMVRSRYIVKGNGIIVSVNFSSFSCLLTEWIP